jgi:hypothetical protein
MRPSELPGVPSLALALRVAYVSSMSLCEAAPTKGRGAGSPLVGAYLRYVNLDRANLTDADLRIGPTAIVFIL